MQSVEATATIADGARTWVAGARAEAERYAQTRTSEGAVADEVTPRALGSAAAYAQLQWRIGDALTILPGARVEAHGRYGASFTPRLAAALRPSPPLDLRASIGRGYRAPSAKELGFAFDHAAYGYRVIGNPALTPETSWGANADATWRPSTDVVLRGGVFANWVDHLIDVDLAGGRSSDGVVDYRYRNFGEARTFGAHAGAAVQVIERLRAEVDYDHHWTRDDVNDRPLGGRPPHTLTASLRATPFWKIEAYARWRVASDAFVSTEARSPGYTTLDLRVAREMWPRSQAYVGVLDLFDVHQDPGRIGDLRPPQGRVLYVGLRAALPFEEE
jgi:outer membrane receptor for ferrienterochelin and colicins